MKTAGELWGVSTKKSIAPILAQLFPHRDNDFLLDNFENKDCWYQRRVGLDSAMFKKAMSLGYDAIVLMTKTGRKELERKRKPRSIELNLLNV